MNHYAGIIILLAWWLAISCLRIILTARTARWWLGDFVDTKMTSSQRLRRRRDRLRKSYEPRARLSVRPGGLCRRRLDGTLLVSNQIQSPLGGGLREMTTTGLYLMELGLCLLSLRVTSGS